MVKKRIAVTAKMAPGNFEAKFYPLIQIENIASIHILRKMPGPQMYKVNYHVLPKLCRFKLLNILISPMVLASLVKKHKAQLILSYHIIPHAFIAFVASLLTRVPFNVSQTGGKIQHLCERSSIIRICTIYVLKKAAFINVPGEYSKQYWIKKGIPKNKINILHSVIDTNKFFNMDLKKEYDFVFVGELTQRKNVALIIKAFSEVKNKTANKKLSLLIIGKGPEEQDLKSLCIEKGLVIGSDVVFYGYSRDIPRLLNQSKIMVMASKIEGLPVALMEAMACELIVIGPDVDNVKQALQDENNGFLLTDHSVSQLRQLMQNALLNYNSLKFLRKNARKTIIDHHSVESAIAKWEKILQDY